MCSVGKDYIIVAIFVLIIITCKIMVVLDGR